MAIKRNKGSSYALAATKRHRSDFALKKEPESNSENESSMEISASDVNPDSDSQDELDELDLQTGSSDTSPSDPLLEDKSTEPSLIDPNKKSSKEQHVEQRKVLAERKLQRKSGTQVQQIKNLWEKLRVKKPTPSKQVREKLCSNIWDLSKDVILELVMKHDASRVVQTLVKYSSKERREKIVLSLKGHCYHLATSAYGKYLLIKLLHYGSKESRTLIINELHGKLRKLMRHREGAYVVEDLYVLYATNEQKHQMMREFWGAEYAIFRESGKGLSVIDLVKNLSEKKLLIMSNLFGTIKASVEKGSTGFQVLHAAMKEYTSILASDIEKNEKQIREFIELLGGQCAELVHTQEGSEVACILISLATAKERKQIAKTLKAHEFELIRNEHGNNVLITLYMTIDDTKMLNGALVADFCTEKEIISLIKQKFSRRPLLYLLNGLDGKYFSPFAQAALKSYQDLAHLKTSKKDKNQRFQELHSRAVPAIYLALVASTRNEDPDWSFTGILSVNIAAQFVTELILTESNDSQVNQTLRPQLLQAVIDSTVKGEVLEDYHLINKAPFVSRLLKAVIMGNEFRYDHQLKKVVSASGPKIASTGPDFAATIINHIFETDIFESWTRGQAAFVVVSIYDVLLSLPEHSHTFKKLQNKLKGIKNSLMGDDKGALLLANRL